jgi:methionine-rich copper-binding protein CopC
MGGKFTRTAGLLLAAIASTACVLLPAAPAAAHNSLTSSDPKDGARLNRAPAGVTLAFLSRLDPHTTKITVTGPDNVSAAGGAPTFSGAKVAVPFQSGPAGLYTVGYEVASTDGHPIRGKIRFTLTVGAPSSVAPTPSVPPTPSTTAGPAVAVTPTELPSASIGPALAPVAGDDRDRSTWWPWAAAGGLVLVAAAAGGLLLRRRPRAN